MDYLPTMAPQALELSYDCPGASELTLKDMDKIDWLQNTPKLLGCTLSVIDCFGN